MSDSFTVAAAPPQTALQDVPLGNDAGPDGRPVPRTGCLSVKHQKNDPDEEDGDGDSRKKAKIDYGPSLRSPASSPRDSHHRVCGQAGNHKPKHQLLGSYTCPICLDSIKNAVATPCGHMMCGECLFGIFRMEALRKQEAVRGQQRLAVVCDMARGVPEAPVPSALSGSSTQSRVLYFCSGRQIATVVESVARFSCLQWLTRLIEDARVKPGHGAHRAWTKFLSTLLRVAIYTGGVSNAPDAIQKIGVVLATAPATDLGALLCGTREPNGPVEQAIWDVTNKLSVLLSNDGASPSPLPSLATLPALWSLFAAGAPGLVQVSAKLQGASALILTLRQASTRLSLQEPVAHGHLPRIVAEGTTLSELLEFAEASSTVHVLASARTASPAVYHVLDRLSAYLWTLTDSGQSFDDLFTAARNQRIDALRRRDPHTPSGLRLTSKELDPLVGTACPACRAAIPGGFFGQKQRQGVQGLKLKLARANRADDQFDGRQV